MRKLGLLVAGVAALSAAPALAYLNTTNFGLPASWTFGTNDGYGTIAATYNNASAMCVDCHTVNPSRLIYTPSDEPSPPTILALGASGSEAFRGSHTVMNALMTGKNLYTYTNSGGGFPGGYGPGPFDDGSYMKGSVWTNLGTDTASSIASKWNTTTAAPLTSGYEDAGGFSVGNAGLICESCHNIRRNKATTMMLLGNYADNSNDEICVSCHTRGGTAYSAFHGNDKLAGFAGTAARKRHHVLTADVWAAGPYGTGNDSVMWAPSYSDKLASGWCGAGAYSQQPGATAISGLAVEFRNACNVSGVGAKATSVVTGDILPVSANDIKCTNCHRPHNAMSGGGAFILRTGYDAGTDFTGQLAGQNGSGQVPGDNIGWGIRRQNDVGTYSEGGKVYGEYNVLCNGCHQGYGI